MRVESLAARGCSTAAVLDEFDELLAGPTPLIRPHFVFAFYGQQHDDEAISRYVGDRFPGAAVVGGTSCAGVMTTEGVMGLDSVGLLLVEDGEGFFGSASAPLGSDPAGAAEAALHTALERADSAGELPELIWVYQSPGREEAVVEGLRRVVGDRCPILGGSSADDDVSGRWRQLGPDGPQRGSLVVGVLFPSGGIGFSFQGGYQPTGTTGVVTEVGTAPGNNGDAMSGSGRHIMTIDGKPAAAVYNDWIGGSLDQSVLGSGGNILAETTMSPLAVDVGRIDDVTQFKLIHPDSVSEQGGLTTFAEVAVGTRVYAMVGDRDRLVRRAGRVATEAVSSLRGADVAGGLLVYCGGCLLAVDERAGEMAVTAGERLGGRPMLGCFTFGEQGMLLGRNVHANLMISAIVFGR